MPHLALKDHILSRHVNQSNAVGWTARYQLMGLAARGGARLTTEAKWEYAARG